MMLLFDSRQATAEATVDDGESPSRNHSAAGWILYTIVGDSQGVETMRRARLQEPPRSPRERYAAGKRKRERLPRQEQATCALFTRHPQQRLDTPADVAFKLVGTGSVGTRDYVVLLFGNGVSDPLFIQVKQELPSCYRPYLRTAPPTDRQGRRVAEGQQMMQTLSDPFLGCTQFGGHDYLVRQLADHKAALDPTELRRRTLLEYARLCGEVLAKGHARTTDAAVLAGYVGKSSRLDEAIATFAAEYAEQTKADYRLFARSHTTRYST
jgi:uncharacterized protein (DUF2252 family)